MAHQGLKTGWRGVLLGRKMESTFMKIYRRGFFPLPVLYGERVASAGISALTRVFDALRREPGEGHCTAPHPVAFANASATDLSPHCGERESATALPLCPMVVTSAPNFPTK